MQPHDQDLKRRFFEIDYVSEFQKYWAMFNKWFKSETGRRNDRDAIESLKSNRRITNSLQKFAYFPVDPILIDSLYYGLKDYYIYSNESVVSSFVQACWYDPVIRPKLNLFNPNNINSVRGTATIHLTVDQFRTAYSRGKETIINYMHLEPPSMSLILGYKGIGYTGSCFFRDESQRVSAPSKQEQQLSEIWSRFDASNSLKILSDLRNSPIDTGYFSDILEMLYVVRNSAIHGDLDYLDEYNNATARNGVIVLNELMKEIIR